MTGRLPEASIETKLNKTKELDLRQADSVVYQRGRRVLESRARNNVEEPHSLTADRTWSAGSRAESRSYVVASFYFYGERVGGELVCRIVPF